LTDYSRLPLHTPERIRYNKAAAAKARAKTKYDEARAAYRAAGETFRDAIQEEISARQALMESLGMTQLEGKPHGTDPD
jgi:hypothetical protein